MKPVKLVSLVLLIILLSGCEQKWTPWANEDGAYMISFPGTPLLMERPKETEFGTVSLKMYYVADDRSSTNNNFYGVVCMDYPDSIVQAYRRDSLIDEFLDSSVETGLAETKGKLIFKKNIKFHSYPGRHIKISVNLKGKEEIMQIKYYLVKNRLYLLEVGCLQKHDNNLCIRQFFDSFELLNKGRRRT